jgi:RNAse (barnase) inhibitor barstar
LVFSHLPRQKNIFKKYIEKIINIFCHATEEEWR